MFYLIKNNNLMGYADYKFSEECLETDIITKAELDDSPNKVIVSDGILVLNNNYEEEAAQKEQARIANLSLTKREVFLALYKHSGITPEEIKSGITDIPALIEFEYANEYFRGNPLINMIGASLGYTSEQLDYLFEHKEFPPEDKEAEDAGMVL